MEGRESVGPALRRTDELERTPCLLRCCACALLRRGDRQQKWLSCDAYCERQSGLDVAIEPPLPETSERQDIAHAQLRCIIPILISPTDFG